MVTAVLKLSVGKQKHTGSILARDMEIPIWFKNFIYNSKTTGVVKQFISLM